MSGVVEEIAGVRVLMFGPDGAPVRGESDAIDLIGEAIGHDVTWVAVPVERLGDEFFQLSTRIAGDVIQKFVNYQRRLAVVGDISRHLEASKPLRDFVYESNRGRHVWFAADRAELEQRLAQGEVQP
jgi:hypothetical protein